MGGLVIKINGRFYCMGLILLISRNESAPCGAEVGLGGSFWGVWVDEECSYMGVS